MELWKAAEVIIKDYYTSFGRMEMESGKAAEIFPKIIDRAGRDMRFRTKLLNAPVEVLEREGFQLPKGFHLKFVEASENTIYLPLLPFIGEKLQENSEKPLTGLHEIMQLASGDRAFRKELIAQPEAVLKKRGFELKPDQKVLILECTDDLFYAILPRPETRADREPGSVTLEIEEQTICLSGRLDAEGVERIRDTLIRWEGDLTLDLKHLDYISSAGLSLFLMILKRLKKEAHSLKLIHLKPTVRNVFVLAGFDQIFKL